jgi:hypothetical protein
VLEYLISRELISSGPHRFLRGERILASLLLGAGDSNVDIVDIMYTKEPMNRDFLMKELKINFPTFLFSKIEFSKKSDF